MISEARLFKKKNAEPVFDGVLVLLMTPKKKFRGHTIITSDQETAKRWNTVRWKKLNPVTPAEEIKTGSFLVFSDTPEEAVQLADDDLMELLHRLSNLFDRSKVSVVFYGGNKVLLCIPFDGDLFEPGDIYMPVTSRQDILRSKKEVEQILKFLIN